MFYGIIQRELGQLAFKIVERNKITGFNKDLHLTGMDWHRGFLK
jgi:hypothetical protein